MKISTTIIEVFDGWWRHGEDPVKAALWRGTIEDFWSANQLLRWGAISSLVRDLEDGGQSYIGGDTAGFVAHTIRLVDPAIGARARMEGLDIGNKEFDKKVEAERVRLHTGELVEGLKASGLNPIVIDENTDFSKLGKL